MGTQPAGGSDDDVTTRVMRLFDAGERLHESYERPDPSAISAVIPGILWQAHIFPRGASMARVLRVYSLRNGNAIVERFWMNEVRALHRLAARQHPALPRLADAQTVRHLGLGFLVVEDAGFPLEGGERALATLRGNRQAALNAFAQLVDAVSVLHTEGIIHRSITPSVVLGDAAGEVHLDGFQISALVSGLLRGSDRLRDRAAAAFIPTHPTSAACLAPERLRSLLGDTGRGVESFVCDVFGLGMLAADWFAGPLDAAHGNPAISNGVYDEAVHAKFVEATHARLQNNRLPAELRRLLEQMTAFSPSNRIPSASEVATSLRGMFRSLTAQFDAASGAPIVRPRLVYFLRETVERFYEAGIGRTPPTHPDEREYADLVMADLDSGSLSWSATGFARWAKRDGAEDARIVMVGQRHAYFCEYFNQAHRDENARVLLVKYACPLHVLKGALAPDRKVPLGRITALFHDPNSRNPRPIAQDSPTWATSVDGVRNASSGETESPVAAAAEWLVGYQEGLLAAREFTFERLESGDGADEPVDDGMAIVVRSTGLARTRDPRSRAAAFLELLRRHDLLEPMAECFERAHEEALAAGTAIKFAVRDESGKDLGIRLEFDLALDPDTVRFRSLPNGAMLPSSGTISPDDRGGRVALERQETAVRALRDRHDLLAQLREPRGVRFEGSAREGLLDTALTRSPDAARQVQRIIEEEPFYVVQGPPGTGKTFIASHAIKALLRADPLARVLVSAQSNSATDNILEALNEKLDGIGNERPLLFRHTSAEAHVKLSAAAAEFTVEGLVARARQRIGEAIATPGLAVLQKQWRRIARDFGLDAELYFRLPRAANVVFATCIGAGADIDAFQSGFDWVVIEEAARAWISELAVPLVRGNRWLLIGDHAQLPAHGADDVERAFSTDRDERVTVEATGNAPTEALRPYLSHFRHLMEVEIAPGHWTKPRSVLEEQRRMAPDIGDLVSHAYYGGTLRTHADTHPANRPHGIRGRGLGFLAGTSLAWLDTSSYGPDAHDKGYVNELELHLVRLLLSRVEQFPVHERDIAPVAIISPYKRQLKRLASRAMKHGQITEDCFHTVDSVQGREAEVVIVSLARNNDHPSQGSALGFLAAPERANVMFSRARRLLVVIGALSHFERFPGTHWGRVIKYLRERGPQRYIVNPQDALDFEVPWRRP
jgi:AAA domain